MRRVPHAACGEKTRPEKEADSIIIKRLIGASRRSSGITPVRHARFRGDRRALVIPDLKWTDVIGFSLRVPCARRISNQKTLSFSSCRARVFRIGNEVSRPGFPFGCRRARRLIFHVLLRRFNNETGGIGRAMAVVSRFC